MRAGLVQVAKKGENAPVGGRTIRRIVYVLDDGNEALERLNGRGGIMGKTNGEREFEWEKRIGWRAEN